MKSGKKGKSWKKSVPLVLLIFVIFLFPFIIAGILPNSTEVFLKYTGEVWFGFIASYLGAIGTFSLGLLALYQNREYKNQSDTTNERLLELQEEIKELNKKNVELIEINTRIEKAKYYPVFMEEDKYYINGDVESIDNYGVFHIIEKKDDLDFCEKTVDEIFKQYNTIAYSLKNIGEKVVRNFHCKRCIVNNDDKMWNWISYFCDVESGMDVNIVLATKEDILEEVRKGNIKSVSFEYEMENVIGENFGMDAEMTFEDDPKGMLKLFVQVGNVYRK